MGEEIRIPSNDGKSFMAYMALPARVPAPVVVIAQEIFGVNQGLRDKCDWLAGEGFIAVCPDLFWRIEPGIQLTDQTEKEWEKAFALYKAFDVDQGVDDLRATLHTFRGFAKSSGRVGCLGYCLGGKLAYLMAARSDVDACVGYYGVGLEGLLEESSNIKTPLMLHMAEEDKFVPKEAQTKIKAGLAGNSRITIHTYSGLDHAFTRVGGAHYDKEGAKLADSRTVEFLRRFL